MTHGEAMAARLPQLYREGELIQEILDLPGLQLEVLDEDARLVQLAHRFDTAFELQDAAQLAALLNFEPEPWQSLSEFRAWVHTLRDARLRYGSVTPAAIQTFIADYTQRYQVAVGIRTVPPITQWQEQIAIALANAPPVNTTTTALEQIRTVHTQGPTLLDNPPHRIYHEPLNGAGIQPLQQFQVIQGGVDLAYASVLLTGLPTGPESVPVFANITTGEALVFLGNVPPGARLWLRATPSGAITAQLERQDVTDRLRFITNLEPGKPWSAEQIAEAPQALRLPRGVNNLWFLAIAHFDTLGLDRFLLALPDLLMQPGRYNETQFNRAIFDQEPAVRLSMTWVEAQPARFSVHLPAATLLSPIDQLEPSLAEYDDLDQSLNQAVQSLRAAGIQSQVELEVFREVQGQMDFLTQVLPLTHREIGPTGADRLVDQGGMFEVTDFNDSVFR